MHNLVAATEAGLAPPATVRGHIPALDGLRGVAVIGVLVFHFGQAFPQLEYYIPHLLLRSSRLGQTGVDLFFVISGFLITGKLLDTKSSAGFFSNFYARRALRTFPLYFAVVFFTYTLFPAWFGLSQLDRHQWWLWTYLANLPSTFGVEGVHFSHLWSLSVEEQFYLVWPAVVFLCDRRALLRVCVGCVLLAVASRVVIEASGYSSFYFTLCRLDALSAGALLAVLARGPSGVRGWSRFGWSAGGALVCGAIPLYVLVSGRGLFAVQIVKYSLTAGLYAALLMIAVTARPNSFSQRMLSLSWLRASGKYSYGIYLFHPFVAASIAVGTRRIGWTVTSPGGSVIEALVDLVIVYGVAWLSYHGFEKRFLRLKGRFV